MTSAVIADNIVSGNRSTGEGLADGKGGGIFLNLFGLATVTVRNNLVIGNECTDFFGRGGGLFAQGLGNVYLEGNTFADNYAEFGGSAVVTEANNLYMRNCIVWGNTSGQPSPPVVSATTIEYCLIEGGAAGVGNIDQDPGFVAGPLGAHYLTPLSPAVDAGDPTSPIPDGTTFPDQSPDIGLLDMGFHYPITPAFVRADCNVDGAIDVGDPVYFLASLFVPGSAPAVCDAACDANGDEQLDVSDAVFMLTWLFILGPAPGEPFPDCGQDPAAATSALSCNDFTACP